MRLRRCDLLLTVFLLCPLAIHCHTSQSARDTAVLLSGRHTPQDRRTSNLLVVSLLDGSLLALDPDTGTTSWTLDLGSPLLSSSGTWFESSVENEDHVSHSILPGADGSLYIFTDASGAGQALERLPANIAQLVEASPSATEDGALLLGSHSSSVYVVDGKTGTLLRVLSPHGQQAFDAEEVVSAQLDLANAVLFGRQDYAVRSIDAVLGREKWNVTYAQLDVLTPPRLAAAARADTDRLLAPAGSDALDADLMGITAGPLNTLRRHDPQSGVGLWTLQLDSPAVAVHLADGTSLKLHGASATAENASSVVVGTLRGSMYALPVAADWLQSGLPPQHPGQSFDSEPQIASIAEAAAHPSLQDTQLDPSSGRLITINSQDAQRNQHAQRGQYKQHAHHARQAEEAQSSMGICAESAAGLGERSQQAKSEGPRKSRQSAAPSTALMQLPQEPSNGPEALWQCPVSLHSVVTTTAPQSFLPNLTDVSSQGGDEVQVTQQPHRLGWRAVMYMTTVALLLLAASIAVAVYIWRRKQSVALGGSQILRKASTEAHNLKQGPATHVAAHSGVHATPKLPAPSTGHETAPKAPAAGKKVKRKGQSMRYATLKPVPEKPQSNIQMHEETAAGSHEALPINSQPSSSTYQGATEHMDFSGTGKAVDVSPGAERPAKSRITRSDGSTVIGHMEVGPQVLGYGSQGTMVYEGSLHGRAVAVKRMLRHLYHLAKKEIDALILSDEHACVVRCFAMEEDAEFVYLALERCKHSLADVLTSHPSSEHCFVDSHSYPTPICMQVAEDIGQGLLALHERGIVHRDLKPHNVLLTAQRRGKVSDMGHCKRLLDQQASFESLGAGGSSGWQAPEQLIARSGGDARQGYTTDIFSYGMLLFHCLTAGKHPFGEHYERDFNILQGRFDLNSIGHLPEAEGMIRSMLAAQPGKRPSIRAVMQQPFWWSAARRLAFLIHLSDRLEMEDRELDQSLLHQLEALSEEAVGGRDWASALGPEVVANLGKYRKYNGGSLRDLLRVIRNKHNHFREMPLDLQQKLGPLPEGFLRYFTARFPRLLLTSYKFAEQHCSADPPLQDYFPHAPLQAGPLPLHLAMPRPLPSPSVTQQALEDASKKHLPSAPAKASPLMSTQPSHNALVSESDASVGATLNVLVADNRVGGTGAVPTPHLGVQNWDLLFPHSLPPAPWSQQHSCVATSTDAAHEHRQIWWPRQGSGLSDISSSKDHTANNQLLVGALHRAPDNSQPPQEVHRSQPTAFIDDQSDHEKVHEQMDDSNRGSRRPAAVSAAWAVHQQGISCTNHISQQCCQQKQGLLLGDGDGACQQLEDSAWPPLAANTAQQQKQATQHDQGQQQQQQQQQQHCSSSVTAERQHDCLPASCSRSHADKSLINPTRSKDAAPHLNLVPISEPSEAHTDAVASFPQRPGQTLCEFYVRTGFCKFGQGCKFDHPVQFAVCLNGLGLPLRHQEATCPFYAKTGVCKYGPSCKFDHPEGV